MYLMTLGQDKIKMPKEEYTVLFTKAKRKVQNPLSFSGYYSQKPRYFDDEHTIKKLLELQPEDMTDDDLDLLLREFKIAMKENRELHNQMALLKKRQLSDFN